MAQFVKDIMWRLEALFYDGFTFLMRLMPIDMASDSGGWLFRKIGPLTKTHHTVLTNLSLAFPHMKDDEIQKLALDQWEQTGRTTAEFPLMDRLKSMGERYKINGLEHLDDYKANAQPFIVASMHQANWELVPIVVLSQDIPFLVTYRAANNPYVDERIRQGRFRYGVRLFGPKGSDGAKEIIQALEDGTSIGLMNDQKFNRGIKTTFFGHEVETAPGPSRLALRFQTDIVPISVKRLHKARFIVTIHPPIKPNLSLSKSQTIDDMVQSITRWTEDTIKENPKDWFWVHKRWPNNVYKKR